MQLLLPFLFSILTILSITPHFQYAMTKLHEIGHIIHLRISSILLKQTYHKSEININKSGYFTLYSGYTHNPLYKYFEDNKMYNYIRINAISGTLFVTLVFITTGICFDILLKQKYYLIFTIPNMALEILNFFTSSDFKYFIKPEEYKYL